MSSHHVVRESQEPALFILQPDFLSAPHMAPLLEWSPTIVVVGEVLHEVLESGIKIDAVVFPEEQAEEVEELLQDQLPVAFVSLSRQESPLLKALNFLAGKGQQAVNILTASEKGDHMLPELSNQKVVANVVLFTGREKIVLCRSGSYTKWYPARETVKIQPASQKLVLSTKGFAENVSRMEIQGWQVFQTEQAGTISVHAREAFWITEQLA